MSINTMSGCVLGAKPNRLVAVRCATDEDEASVVVEDALDEVGELLVVFGDQNAERCRRSRARSLSQAARRMRR